MAAFVALVVLNLAVYAPVRHAEFVQLDDPAYVTENPEVLAGLTAHGTAWALTTGHSANWHPVTWLSHMLDVQVFGLNAGAQHAVNVGFHVLNTLLLFVLLLSLTGAPVRSAFVAALFAVHPLHVESVAWIAERKDVLSTFFWMLTLLAYLMYVRRPGWMRYAAMVGLFALGLMAKPMLVTLPIVLLLLDVWPLERFPKAEGGRRKAEGGRREAEGGRREAEGAGRKAGRKTSVGGGPQAGTVATAYFLVREKLPLFALAIASSIVTYIVQQQGGAVSGLEATSLSLRVANAFVSYAAYLWNTIWPAGLTVIYPFPSSIPGEQVAGAVLVLAAISWVAVRAGQRHRYLLVGWLWYLCTLVPVIGIVRVGVQARADRYTYVPLIGIFVMIAWGVHAIVARSAPARRAVGAIGALVVIAFAVVAHAQVASWDNDIALWTRATMLTLHVDEFNAHESLGRTLTEKDRLDEAVEHFNQAVRLQPASAQAHLDLGVAKSRQGKNAEALAEFVEAARLRPDFEQAHINLAVAYANAGRADQAVREFNEVLRINPGNESARRAVQGLLSQPGRF